MNTRDATQLVMDALSHTVAGDADEAATALISLGESDDDSLMFGACCALAEAGKRMLQRIYGEHTPRPGSDDMWIMEELKPGAADDNPAEAFSMRFLVSYANGDIDTCLALYAAAVKASDEQYVDSVICLLKNVAGITRLALEHQKGDSR